MIGKIIWMSWVGVPCIISQLRNSSGLGVIKIIIFRGKDCMCISYLDFPHAFLWRCTGKAVISSTQLTDIEEKKIGKSGPGV